MKEMYQAEIKLLHYEKSTLFNVRFFLGWRYALVAG
jgi:hypothetical protein